MSFEHGTWLAMATLGLLGNLGLGDEPTSWSRFRGPNGSGVDVTAMLPLELGHESNLQWQHALPGKGASSPVNWNGQVFLTASTIEPNTSSPQEHHVICLDLEKGIEQWRYTSKALLPEQEIIREDHGYASQSPVVDETGVYAFFGKSGVIALDHEGKLRWQASVGTQLHGWGSATSPILYRDLVILNASVESESVIALDKASGKERWRRPGIRESWNTPIIASLADGSVEIILAMLRKVIALNPETGDILWECDTQINWYMCPGMLFDEGVIYAIGGRSGGGLAIKAGGRGDVTQSHVLWRLDKGTNVPTPLFHQGYLYFVHENLGIAYCVEGRSGQLVYEERIQPSPGQIYASPVLANDRIYILSRQGHCVVLAAQPSFEILARSAMPKDQGLFHASPAIVKNRILIRSDRMLYCIGSQP